MTEFYILLASILFTFLMMNCVVLVEEENLSVSTFFSIKFTDFRWVMSSLIMILIIVFAMRNTDYIYIIIGLFISVIVIYDLKYLLAPDFMISIIAIINVSYLLVTERHLSALSEGLIICIVVFFAWLISAKLLGDKIGGGDFKLIMGLSFLLGIDDLFLMFFFMCMSVLAITPIALMKGKNLKTLEIPLVPFMLIGYIITVTYGDRILNWYLGGIW